MASNSVFALAVTTGVAAIVGGVVVWKLQQPDDDDEEEPQVEDILPLIQLEDVGKLLNSPCPKVRRAAENYLLQRAARSENLIYILQQSLSDNLLQVAKSVSVIRMLAKTSDEYKKKLVEARALMILPQCIGKISDDFNYKTMIQKCKDDVLAEKIVTRCIGAIFQLVIQDSTSIISFSKETLLIRNIMLNVLADEGYHVATDMKRWSTYILNQLSQCTLHPIKKSLKKWGIIRKTSQCIMATLGDLLQTQLCLQTIIYYLNDTIEDIVEVCEEMASLGILPHLIGLLRCDEEENIVQLSAVIIHHFCCFDIETKYLSSVSGIVKILFTVLNSQESIIQKTIIRIANYLSVGSTKFQKMLIEHKPMIKKLSVCLSSGHPDVVQGSLMLIHDLAMPGKKFAQTLVTTNPDILKALVSLSMSSAGETVQLIAETLGFICSCESLHSLILQHGVVNAILHFAKSSDVAVQFWASALLLNLSMISDDVKEMIIRNGGVQILLQMAVSGDEVELPDIATNATKTLVILGFLDAVIKVNLTAGTEGSIIIDGTEHCPGKQGVNLISLDFVNYKYSKGRVIRPEELQAFVTSHFESWKKSDPVFVVTQGDCTVLFEGQTIPEAFNQLTHTENSQFLYSPSWCFILTPSDTKIQYGRDSIDYKVEIRMNDFVSIVLKESFSDPLIDVLLSMPPASNINKTSELELIEILARHSYQRKAIVASNRFISYLYELLWAVASSKSHDFKEIENTTKISHCLSSLKILHSCSVDSDCLQDLLGQGLLQVLGAVLNTILLYLLNLSKSASSESSQKSTWYDLIETPVPEEKEEGLNEPIEDDNDDTIFHDVLEARSPIFSNYDSDGSEVNDELFQLADTGSQSETPQPTRRRTIRYADEMMSESATGGGERSQVEVNSSRRMRTDSFIVRSDSRQLRREDIRRQSVLDFVSSTEVGTERSFSVLDMRPTSVTASVSVEHQQLRRISRSMSVSMQQTKSSGKIDEEHSTSLNDVLMKILNHTVILLYRVTNTTDAKVQEALHSMSILPMLLTLPGCVNKEFKRRIGLAVTSGLMNVSHKNRDQGNMEKELILEHVGETKSCILSSNKFEVSNENWYFESVKFNQGISKVLYEDCKTTPKGWYYEVEIGSEGIIQIGYANESCEYDAKKGIGIGDTVNSYGFDGARRKIWSGPTCDVIVDNDYGVEWQSGDIVSVLLTWNGILSYWLNGKNLGVAMRNIDTSKIWYPGLSLSVDQYCRFIVNRNEFRYKCPDGYHSIPDIRNFTMAKRENELQESTILPTDYNCLDLTGKEEFTEQCIWQYYEIDVTPVKDDTIFQLGFKGHRSDPGEDEKKDSDGKSSAKTFFSFLEAIKKSETVKVIGCGISIPDRKLLVTLNGVLVAQKPLSEYEEQFRDISEEELLNFIPYVSLSHVKVNVGQEDFLFYTANNLKLQSCEYMCNIFEKADS